jgi:hypothetical protein
MVKLGGGRCQGLSNGKATADASEKSQLYLYQTSSSGSKIKQQSSWAKKGVMRVPMQRLDGSRTLAVYALKGENRDDSTIMYTANYVAQHRH